MCIRDRGNTEKREQEARRALGEVTRTGAWAEQQKEPVSLQRGQNEQITAAGGKDSFGETLEEKLRMQPRPSQWSDQTIRSWYQEHLPFMAL